MFELAEILNRLNLSFSQLNTENKAYFNNIEPFSSARSDSLIFFNKPTENTIPTIKQTKASVVLIERKWGEMHKVQLTLMTKAIFLVENPRLVIAKILAMLFPKMDLFADEGIHPTAIVHPNASLHPSVSVGANCILGECIIGENSRIGPFTSIKDDVIIGNNVVIREYCLIGSQGFGFARDEKSIPIRIPHIGKVVIEDNVEIFPYVNIDRGTLLETRVKKNSKIDHYCHIGHNSTIGESCLITAGTVLCGGSSVGDRVWTGVGSIIKEDIKVGNDVVLGLGSVVIRDIDDNQVVAGVPAKFIRSIK